MYSEVLKLIASFEAGLAFEIKRKSEELKLKIASAITQEEQNHANPSEGPLKTCMIRAYWKEQPVIKALAGSQSLYRN
jgi:hypothetical protein